MALMMLSHPAAVDYEPDGSNPPYNGAITIADDSQRSTVFNAFA